MGNVVSFRPTPDEDALLARTQEEHGFQTRSEALRFLLQRAAESHQKVALRRFLDHRIPELQGDSLTSREIDDLLYGDL